MQYTDYHGQVEIMTVSDKAGKELSKLTYTYDLAGNKLTSTEEVEGKEEETRFSYDDNNRLIKLENKDGITTYTYDRNGNRISSKKNDDKLDYIYDTENRLLAVKDKEGLLMAALYDGDDNRVFTASRKEGKHTYQLFKREDKKKSPYTAPAGEANSLFWYGFSQNVLQALSTLPQTVGSIWHELFDDVSTAYHQKVAKDRATKEGLVVNPPDLGDLPGEGQVTYASEVKEVLIPYTTREDRFNYYEERNYVNDVNRKHTEVLQTYDRELKARETYTYGQGRTSYLNHETGDQYHYLTNQAGSSTGLTKDGNSVASSSYNLYGATKSTTDETGNPFAYNGEARDITRLDYLRARYYDSQAGTFLTEDSYSGTKMNPLSQNRYSYVHNNPVNYTDPSGHIAASPFTMFLGAGKPRYSQPKPLINYKDGTLYAPTTAEHKAHQTKEAIKKIAWKKVAPAIKYGAALANGLVSDFDKVGQGLDVSSGLGGILRSINPIAKMGGKTGFVIQNASSPLYKAGTLFNKIGQKAAPVAKVLTSKTFQAIGFVAGVVDDMANQGKTIGQAVAHNGAGLAVGAAALALTPVGWGVVGAAAVGVAAGFVFDAAYNSNFLRIRDALDWVPKRKLFILV